MNCQRQFLAKTLKAVSAAAFVTVLIVSFAPTARAQMGIFNSETMALMHCPNDEVVWLDFKKRRYYTRGQRQYERGRSAVYACKKEARASGYKRSKLGLR
jgi:hypothetical protein